MISGVLAVVALALLIAGLASTGLTLVYVSIGVSLVSAVFLGVGAYQRRGEELAAPRPAPEPLFGGTSDEVTRVVSPANTGVDEAAVRFAEPASGDGEGAVAATVLVVPGRPRYHVEGCRYLVGKETEERSVAEARNEGFSACGICRPDENLPAARVPELTVVGDTDEPGAAEPAAVTTRRPATKTAAKTGAKKAAAKKAPPAKTAAKAAPAKRATTKQATTAKAATTKKTAAAKKSTAARGASVVVIPDRDKFHKSDCRFVKGVRGTAELPKTEARRQGYEACGVCKP